MRRHHKWAAILLGAAALLLAPAAATAQVGMRPAFAGFSPYAWGYPPWAGGYPYYYPGTSSYSWGGYPTNAGATYDAPSYPAGNTTFTPSAIAESANHSSMTTFTAPAAAASPAPDTTSYPPAGDTSRAEGTNTAQVNVRVPDASAQVWIEGQLMQQKGARREFVSPALTPGRNYNYEIRARWTENGRTADETRTVPVRANDVVSVDFGAAAASANASRVDDLGNQAGTARPSVTTRVNNNSRIDDISGGTGPARPAAKPPADGGRPQRP